jgi:phosphoribosylformimino-5-aminoimidazole carboxamide ribotide isomerase
MLVIPAIDLMKGKVVRLTRGDPEKPTFYDGYGTPVEVAIKWKREGAERLHVIDLDAAFGKPNNLATVLEINKTTRLPVQVGGGIRSVEAVEGLINAGIQHVILGSLAFKDPEAVAYLLKKYGSERIIVALDNREGMVLVEGWTSATTSTLKDAMEVYSKLGVKSFLITSITADGTLSGPDLDTLKEACQWSSGGVIAAGGIGTIKDLLALKRVGVEAAVVGKALYEDKFTLRQAIDLTKEL